MRFSATHKDWFDLYLALHLARLCETGYFKAAEDRHEEFWLAGYRVRFFAVTESFLLTAPDHAVLLFVGTDEKAEWLNNADIRHFTTRAGKVHRGFNEALDIVWVEILRSLDPKLPLYITGHSRGAALAVLATSRLANFHNLELAGTYTFGCPRVAGYGFAARYPAGTFRVVNNNDIVCRIPGPLRFKHVGKLAYLDRKGRLRTTLNPFRIAFDHLSGRISGRLNDGVADHAISEYIQALASNTAAEGVADITPVKGVS